MRLLFDWLDKLVADQEDELRGRLDPRTAAWLGKIPQGPRRRFMILGSLLRERGPEGLPQPSTEQIDTLVLQLSVEAQEKFHTQTTPTEQQALVRQWIQIALLSRWLPPPVSEKELQRFFVEDLSAEERESLERRPRDELSHELRRRYFHYQLRRRMPDGDFGPGGPPGRREDRPAGLGRRSKVHPQASRGDARDRRDANRAVAVRPRAKAVRRRAKSGGRMTIAAATNRLVHSVRPPTMPRGTRPRCHRQVEQSTLGRRIDVHVLLECCELTPPGPPCASRAAFKSG